MVTFHITRILLKLDLDEYFKLKLRHNAPPVRLSPSVHAIRKQEHRRPFTFANTLHIAREKTMVIVRLKEIFLLDLNKKAEYKARFGRERVALLPNKMCENDY